MTIGCTKTIVGLCFVFMFKKRKCQQVPEKQEKHFANDQTSVLIKNESWARQFVQLLSK